KQCSRELTSHSSFQRYRASLLCPCGSRAESGKVTRRALRQVHAQTCAGKGSMPSRPEQSVPAHRLSGRQVLIGGVVVLIVFAMIRVFKDWGRPEPASLPSFGTATHAPMPLIDVMVIGDSSVAVTNLGGWTPEQ